MPPSHEVEAFRRLGMTEQTTGYILMGLTCIALGLSLRKRWSRVSFGAFRSWRTAHALLGLGGRFPCSWPFTFWQCTITDTDDVRS